MNLLSVDFIASFFYFLLAIFISFYLPGFFFISRLNLHKSQEVILSITTGMVLFAFQGFIFGYLNLRLLTYVYLLLFIGLYIWKKRAKKISLPSLDIKNADYLLLFILFAGVLTQIFSVWFNGIKISEGLYFCCGSVQDSVLHLAITDEIVKRFPPNEPGMYGQLLTNYHYWGSLVIGELIRIFKLPLISTNYQFMTIFVSLMLGLNALVFASVLKIGKGFGRWLLFFLYFGSDFIWGIVAIFNRDSIFFMRPLESGAQFLENLPRAFAVVVFFAAFSLFLIWIKKKDLYVGLIMSFLLASLLVFKVNIGVFAFSGLAFLGIYYLYKREYKMLIPLIVAVIIGAIIYLPTNSSSGGLYYTGFWRFENFVVQPSFKLDRLELARLIYLQHGNTLRVIQYELMYIFIFILAVFGTKLLGFIQTKKSLSLFPIQIHIVFIPAIIISFIAGAFFSQTSGGSNSFNFIVSVYILGSIYTALACFYWLKGRNLIKILLIVLIVGLTLTRSVVQTYSYIDDILNKRGYLIKNEELAAINYFSSLPSGLVIVDPNLEIDKNSPYLTFLTGHRMYLSGIINELEAHNIDYKDRLTIRDEIFKSKNPDKVADLIAENDIRYIYLKNKTKLTATDSAKFLPVIFHNDMIKILEFKK